MDLEIIDNFLDQEYFDFLSGNIMSHNFPWLYESRVANLDEKKDKDFYFTHRVYDDFIPQSSFFDEMIPLMQQMDIHALVRIRAILYANQGEQIIHDKHRDYNFPHKTALLYLNTCNGFTEFEDGERVESVANRLVKFDGSKLHNSSTCTDEKVRVVISINYF